MIQYKPVIHYLKFMFEEKKFSIGKLKGISEKNIEEHLKLYSGYVKFTNAILDEIKKLADSTENPDDHLYAITEMQRRFSFEYNGARNHEIYFASLEGGPKDFGNDKLKQQIEKDFGSFEKWLALFKTIAKTRGPGWAMLCYDQKEKRLLNNWVDEQHIGLLNSCVPILVLDMWEHAFVFDYQPSGKKQYVEDFFENLNWQKIEENLKSA